MSEKCQITRTERTTYDVVALGTGLVLPRGFIKWKALQTPEAAHDGALVLLRSGEPSEVVSETIVTTVSRERVEVLED